MRFRDFGDFVRNWIGERPEYENEIPVDQCVEASRDEVPMGLADIAIRDSLRKTFVGHARGRGMRAVARRKGEDSAVYGYTQQLPMFEFVEVLRDIRRQITNDINSARGMATEWVDAHPESMLTVEDLWAMADPVEQAA